MLESFMRSFGYEKKRARVDDVLSVIGILPITDEAVTSARHSVVDKYEALASLLQSVEQRDPLLDIMENIANDTLALIAKGWVKDNVYQNGNPPRPTPEFYAGLRRMGNEIYAALGGRSPENYGKALTSFLQATSRKINTNL
ncbi:MAG TPA: hypothetical protein VJB66_01060 [Candidatus Nanoarchaeia archaeon]|nr:hypothetical protein [Candidatus Nanoarchaeia archaeon]